MGTRRLSRVASRRPRSLTRVTGWKLSPGFGVACRRLHQLTVQAVRSLRLSQSRDGHRFSGAVVLISAWLPLVVADVERSLTAMERLPAALYALVQVAFQLVHYPTTRRPLRIIAFACLLALLFHSHTAYSLLSPGEDYVLGCASGILVAAAAHTTFFSPEFPNGLQPRNPAKDAERDPSGLPFAQKLRWMAELAGDVRRIAFRRDGGAMAARVDADARKRFVISRVILSVSCLAAFQLTVWYRLQSPFFNPARRGGAGDDPAFIRTSPSLLRRCWEVAVWATGTVSEMSLLQAVPAALAVAVGASEPEDWPPMFGSPAHAYSVRRFWS
jgi:hypothetical protein